MARIAHREGYPEVGLYWEKAAYEEAEHAAKFAEMLGSTLVPQHDRLHQEEPGLACGLRVRRYPGQVRPGRLRQEERPDAIHDTVHEMARDEARHGRALKGLLERYFK